MDLQKLFLEHLAPTSPFPFLLNIKSANGIYLEDIDGKKYMDLIAGIGVASVGHANPKIIEAVTAQIKNYGHVMVYGEYIQEPVVQLATNLAAALPDNLQTCYFVNSGAEANEAAIKLAKRVTGRSEIISFERAYHGNTMGAMSVSGNEVKKQAFRPLVPGVRFIPFNSIDDLEQITNQTAAVIIEPIQGDAGVIIPDKKFMVALRQRCDETGAILIFDEIQTGMGRTGKLFAFEHFGVTPDILTLAKGLGGGLPIGAFISSKENMSLLARDPMLGHITTFGGNPVCCASALAALSIINQNNFLEEVETKGQLFESLLEHENVVEIRRKGLMMAIELNAEEKVDRAIELAREEGVIIYWFLSTRNCFRISPPLTITTDEVIEASTRLQRVFERL